MNISFRKYFQAILIQSFTFWLSFLPGDVLAQDLDYRSAIDSALIYLNFSERDLSIRTDLTTPDTFRLGIVDFFFQHPLELPDSVNNLASDFVSDSSCLRISQKLGPLLSNNPMTVLTPPPLQLKKNRALRRNPAYFDLISRLFTLQRVWSGSYARFVSGLTREELRSLQENTIAILQEEDGQQDLTILESAHAWRQLDSLSQEWYQVASRLNPEALVPILIACGSTLDEIRILLRDLPAWKGRKIRPPSGVTGEVLYYDQDKGFLITGKGSNQIKGNFSFILDLGGNDHYLLDSVSHGACSIIIDLGGDDLYQSLSDFSLAGGLFSLNIIYDVQGNDSYLGRDFSLGCGLYGIGWLEDLEGNDTYRCDLMGEGAGFLGMGILHDRKGNDSYIGSLYAQGFGGVSGIGFLLDRNGYDSYQIQSSMVDVIRYQDHILSLSQGFAYGIRPYASGGIGLLIDFKGNDFYGADIFAQGGSYWYGLGALLDYSGNDSYFAHQYVQGSGIHLSLGYLRDEAGDDHYNGYSLAQGVGHDYGIGIFQDQKGNDNYVVQALSQGAGSANGVGIFIDEKGDDAYISRVDWHNQGYGNPRREYGSIGIFLDLQGRDLYTGRGKNSYIWWLNSSKRKNWWGIGLDLE